MSASLELEKVRYIADESGHRTAAVVPIELWREIESEIETRYLLDNPVMRQRLLDAMNRNEAIPLRDVLQRLGVTEEELDDEVG